MIVKKNSVDQRLSLQIIFPMSYWLYDFNNWRKGSLKQKLAWFFHVFMFAYGCL